MHSEGILAGELKHGPLALIDKEMPVIMIIMRDACYSKCQNALQQVTARSVRIYCTSDRCLSAWKHAPGHMIFHWYSVQGMTTVAQTESLAGISMSIRAGPSSFVARMTLTWVRTPTRPSSCHILWTVCRASSVSFPFSSCPSIWLSCEDMM